MKKIEILAPGGSREAIYAGIYGGADAIYTGTSRFSARAFAENPDVEELCRILDFAHLHEKKIYLTVNTLLTEEELEGSLYDLIRPLYEHGLDAVIVQDFGVMDLIREYFPGMDIHASTQMTLLTGEGANLLRPFGVTRIVPARELSIQEIARMRQVTDLEIEVFVHGALCYCYSGQCLMSKVIGGRSGNRGMCAQPCRLPYKAEGKKAGYLLSPKDLCTLGQVEELIRAGVDSFKIEGRMKKPAYTAYTSYLYRTYADASLSGIPVDDRELNRDMQRLADIYNRGGFTRGYLFEPSKKNIIFPSKNSHYGVLAGTVLAVNKDMAEYRAEITLHPQDVVEFRDEEGGSVYEYTLKEGVPKYGKVRARYKKGSQLRAGQKVYRTRNNELLMEIDDLIEHGRKNTKVPIRGIFRAVCGEPVRLELFFRDLSCQLEGAVAERAKGKPVSSTDIEKRLKKTGESQFIFEDLALAVSEQLFVPLGSIAGLRRQAFQILEQKILEQSYRKAECKPEQIPVGEENKETCGELFCGEQFTLIQITDFRQIEGVKNASKVNATNTRLHFPLEEFSPEEWNRLAEEAGELRFYISLPRVLREKNKSHFLDLWREYARCFQGPECAGAVLSSIEALPVMGQLWDQKREWIAGPELYFWNHRAGRVYDRLGLRRHSYMAYGRAAVMTTEGCASLELGRCSGPEGMSRELEISTPKKDDFTVVNYCNYCYNVIYEKNPGWHEPEGLAEIPEIQFRSEDTEEVREVLEQWSFLS
ncbi:MAG: U32 family peptidase [Eubacterium sp.]|nr:U32 family peptidase [Eubacterium sp.]